LDVPPRGPPEFRLPLALFAQSWRAHSPVRTASKVRKGLYDAPWTRPNFDLHAPASLEILHATIALRTSHNERMRLYRHRLAARPARGPPSRNDAPGRDNRDSIYPRPVSIERRCVGPRHKTRIAIARPQ